MMPTFVGVGAQKCASTWLHRILVDHPQAWVSEPKELDFFSLYFDRGYEWYERFFEDAGEASAVGEISPSYFHDPRAPERVMGYNPEARIVIALRDPIERAYSNHLHEVRIGHFRAEANSFENGLSNNPTYLEQSRYAKHIKPWLETFPQQQLIVFFQEEIKVDPVLQARRLYEFLGIDADHQSKSLLERSNESVTAQVPAIEAVLRGAGHAGRLIGLERIVTATRESALVSKLRNANRRDLRTVIPAMEPQTLEALQEQFAGEVLELARLLGRDSLPWPTWEAAVRGLDKAPAMTASVARMQAP